MLPEQTKCKLRKLHTLLYRQLHCYSSVMWGILLSVTTDSQISHKDMLTAKRIIIYNRCIDLENLQLTKADIYSSTCFSFAMYKLACTVQPQAARDE